MQYYRLMTGLVAPLLPLWLHWRMRQGKEDKARIRERFGYASKPRPKGTLLWIHGASVGEANSVLVLIGKIVKYYPDITVLMTTGTVTSANLMQRRLPKEVIHQYVPVDTPQAVRRFMRHWRPDIALWVESEFWPNLVMEADDAEAFMGIINGRMSQKSYEGWLKRLPMIRRMLSCFNIAFAQTVEDARRLEALGAKDVVCVGNLKFDAELLPCNEEDLIDMQSALGNRPVWLAASTHPGEEQQLAQVHAQLAAKHPGLLTLIVPRHPARGPELAEQLGKSGRISLRSREKLPAADTDIFIADTLGELGLFYRLCEVVFMGGSLAKHGGQNPLEPARLSCAILAGPHTHNFTEIYTLMEKAEACLRVANVQALATQVDRLLADSDARAKLQSAVKLWMDGKGGASERMLDELAPVLDPREPEPQKPVDPASLVKGISL